MADEQHASSWAGDPAHMPDGYVASVNSLKANSGLLGQSPGEATARQDIPGSADRAVKEEYPFRGSVPDPEFAGESGTTNMGPQGSPLDWNSVAPYEYPEFPMQSGKTGASKAPAPLT